MGAPADQLVARACAALRAVVEAPPAAEIGEIADDIEQNWPQLPLRVGVRGDADSRLQLFAVVVGELAHLARANPCPTLHALRGPSARFRATRADGSVEHREATAARPVRQTALYGSPPLSRPAAALERPDAGHAEVQPAQVSRVAVAVARVPTAQTSRPPWWAVWAWIARLFARWFGRRAEPIAAHHEHEVVAEERAVQRVEDAPVVVEVVAMPTRKIEAPAYLARLRELASGAEVDTKQIVVEVAEGPLPQEIELVELASDAPGLAMDLVVAVKQQVAYVVEVHDERVTRIGSITEAPAALVELARHGRAVRIARRAVTILRSVEATLADMVASADARFRGRIAELEALEVPDRGALAAERLAHVRPEVIGRASAIVKHVLAHAGAELDRIDAAWTHEVTEATSTDELQAAVVRIDGSSAAAIDVIVVDARRLLASSLAGGTFDLLPALVAVIVRDHGLPAERIRDLGAAPPSLDILGKLAGAGGASLGPFGGNWFTGLFKSYDARRSEVLAKLRARVTVLRELAMAELLDIEPRLTALLGDTLAALLATALDRQAEWLADRLATEQAAIAAERAAMRPLVRARDSAHDDARDLTVAVGG